MAYPGQNKEGKEVFYSKQQRQLQYRRHLTRRHREWLRYIGDDTVL